MGRRNESGMLTQCNHCGYSWYYQGTETGTSCPKCGWRVRIAPSRRGEVANPAGESNQERRYY